MKFYEYPASGSFSERDKNDEANDRITQLLREGSQKLVASKVKVKVPPL